MVLAIILWGFTGLILISGSVLMGLRNWGGGALMLLLVTTMIGGVGGMFCWLSPLDYPSYEAAPYYTDINWQRIAFADYQKEGDDLIVPTHYYIKKGFVNKWELCDTPIRIEVPEGQDVAITDHRPALQPRMVGGCE